MSEKPQIGLRPRAIAEEMRFNEVCDAIRRYQEAQKVIPIEWVEEYNFYLEKTGSRDSAGLLVPSTDLFLSELTNAYEVTQESSTGPFKAEKGEEEEEKLIYFLCYTGSGAITVIDLHPSVSYERDEWNNVNDETYATAKEAIDAGKRIASDNGFAYAPFSSRYNSSTSEKNFYY